MKKATLEQWIALFNETEKLVKNKPWEQFEDLELFVQSSTKPDIKKVLKKIPYNIKNH